jgi:hypothetical protein
MKSSYQRGTIYEASGSFFVRYFANMVMGERNGCPISCATVTKPITAYPVTAVLALRDEHMVTTRRPTPQSTTDPLITEYWEHVYLPTVKQGLKPSTVAGYEDKFGNSI